eukprot:CAMPEP_0168785654 /NCGR_PEP_ID=MMETSP0725-20121227/10864_1 /TAXON_ID=265536 /ORGANISM="Amphiprora sp., Strain CCMP467" /LENGTH=514 /DNA_ID=CAMNT_0008835771 /DNA_START=392 /DNA_END=1933 /DNA_ORIENTATION=-
MNSFVLLSTVETSLQSGLLHRPAGSIQKRGLTALTMTATTRGRQRGNDTTAARSFHSPMTAICRPTHIVAQSCMPWFSKNDLGHYGQKEPQYCHRHQYRFLSSSEMEDSEEDEEDEAAYNESPSFQPPGHESSSTHLYISNLSEHQVEALRQNRQQQQKGKFISRQPLLSDGSSNNSSYSSNNEPPPKIRLSKLLSSYATNLTLSRNRAEKLIEAGEVTLAGEPVTLPFLSFALSEVANGVVKLQGKAVVFQENYHHHQQQQKQNNKTKDKKQSDEREQNATTANAKQNQQFRTRVWMVHKLSGEVVAEDDPHDRPSMIHRLYRGAVGYNRKQKKREHLKPIGRLDMTTEGLILVTNDGEYARQLELPRHQVHRTYRVRAHGLLAPYKLDRMRSGLTIAGVHYHGMKVTVEHVGGKRNKKSRSGSAPTNQWVRVTCSEGKNRMIRNVFQHLGLNVTRLIRISFGDYHLQRLPPGMAVEMPPIAVDEHKRRGPLLDKGGEPGGKEDRQRRRQRQA